MIGVAKQPQFYVYGVSTTPYGAKRVRSANSWTSVPEPREILHQTHQIPAMWITWYLRWALAPPPERLFSSLPFPASPLGLPHAPLRLPNFCLCCSRVGLRSPPTSSRSCCHVTSSGDCRTFPHFHVKKMCSQAAPYTNTPAQKDALLLTLGASPVSRSQRIGLVMLFSSGSVRPDAA